MRDAQGHELTPNPMRGPDGKPIHPVAAVPVAVPVPTVEPTVEVAPVEVPAESTAEVTAEAPGAPTE